VICNEPSRKKGYKTVVGYVKIGMRAVQKVPEDQKVQSRLRRDAVGGARVTGIFGGRNNFHPDEDKKRKYNR